MPIEVSPTVFGANYIHAVVLLARFYIRFPALVAHPVRTLFEALLPVAAGQTIYCLSCLPIAGSGSKGVKRSPNSKGGAAKKLGDGPQPTEKITVS